MKCTIILMTLLLTTATVIFAQKDKQVPVKGFAVHSKDGKFQPYEFNRHAIGENDILMNIQYAGICHSDIHKARSEWGETDYPFVPGHEIVGIVTQIGKNVTKFKVGDYAAVGCIVNSCGQCEHCKEGEEQFCSRGMVGSNGGYIDYFHDNMPTRGGYSNKYVLSADYAITVPQNADIEKIAPLLCAGITVYSPIHFSKVKKGDNVAVAGFGGLGHLAVKYLVDLGANVTVFDITEDKRPDALDMGAVKYVNVEHPNELKGLEEQFSFIISTIPANYDPMMYVRMLKLKGEFAIVGAPANNEAPTINLGLSFIGNANRKIYASLIGGIKETQEMLDYSVANNIYPEVKIIPATGEAIDEAFDKVVDGKVKFRYVIDMTTMD